MQLLTLPIVAVFSSFATNWYWLGKHHRLAETEQRRAARLVEAGRGQLTERLARFKAELEVSRGRAAELEEALAARGAAVEADAEAHAAVEAAAGAGAAAAAEREAIRQQDLDAMQRRVEELTVQLTESRARAAGVEVEEDAGTAACEAAGVAGAAGVEEIRRPEEDGLAALSGLLRAAWDFMAYAADAAAGCLWPWPADAEALSAISSYAAAAQGRLQAYYTESAAAASNLSELGERVFADVAVHVRGLGVAAAAWTPAPLAAQLQGVQEALTGFWHEARSQLQEAAMAARAGLEASFNGFLEQHPQHRSSIGGLDPVVFFLLPNVCIILALGEIYLAVGFLRAMVDALCCRRRGAGSTPGGGDKAGARGGAEADAGAVGGADIGRELQEDCAGASAMRRPAIAAAAAAAARRTKATGGD